MKLQHSYCTLLRRLILAQTCAMIAVSTIWAQQAPTAGTDQKLPSSTIAPEEIVKMSPFEVKTETNGYYSPNTMSGTRINSSIQDLASTAAASPHIPPAGATGRLEHDVAPMPVGLRRTGARAGRSSRRGVRPASRSCSEALEQEAALRLGQRLQQQLNVIVLDNHVDDVRRGARHLINRGVNKDPERSAPNSWPRSDCLRRPRCQTWQVFGIGVTCQRRTTGGIRFATACSAPSS